MNRRALALAVLVAASVATQSLPGGAAPSYRMSLDVDAAAGAFRGEVAVYYTNETDLDQGEVFFRLYGNAEALYASAFIGVTTAAVDGQTVSFSLFADDTVLLVSLPTPIAPGESREIQLSFLGEAAHVDGSAFAGHTEYGILTRGDGTLTMTGFYPVLAPITDEGWAIDPVASIGDAMFADAAAYAVTLLVAKDVTVIPVPDSVQEAPDGRVRCEFTRQGLRDFSLVLVDGELTPEVSAASGITVRSWFSSRHAQAGSIALDRSTMALDVYSALFGLLPYPTVDVVEIPMQHFAGVECSGMFLVSSTYAADPTSLFFDVIVSHEMAHQWFYAAVGSDPAEEPWLDEALATFASNVFLAVAVSEAAAETERTQWAAAYERERRGAPELRVTSPIYAFPDSATYSAIVYSGGAYELDRLRRDMGDDAFFKGLSDYYNEQAGSIAVGSDLFASFRRACDCWPAGPLFDGVAAQDP